MGADVASVLDSWLKIKQENYLNFLTVLRTFFKIVDIFKLCLDGTV